MIMGGRELKTEDCVKRLKLRENGLPRTQCY